MNKFFEEQVSDMHGIRSLFTCDKVSHFRVHIHYHKDKIKTMLGSLKSQDEVYRQIFLRGCCNGQRHVQTRILGLPLGCLARMAMLDMAIDVSLQLGPIIYFFCKGHGLITTQMTTQAATLQFMDHLFL